MAIYISTTQEDMLESDAFIDDGDSIQSASASSIVIRDDEGNRITFGGSFTQVAAEDFSGTVTSILYTNGIGTVTYTSVSGLSASVDVLESSSFFEVAKHLFSGSDTITASDYDDRILGGRSSDILYGKMGNDLILGGNGYGDSADSADTIYGGLGSDFIYSNAGDDYVNGGESGVAGDAADYIHGGLGADTILGNEGSDTIFGGVGADSLFGQLGDDTLYGGTAIYDPTDSADYIAGGAGNDWLFGNGGADTLNGETGNNVLVGGGGADVLVIANAGVTNDVLTFDDSDKIHVSTAIAASFSAIQNSIAQSGTSTFINFGNSTILILRDYTATNLDANDFVFF